MCICYYKNFEETMVGMDEIYAFFVKTHYERLDNLILNVNNNDVLEFWMELSWLFSSFLHSQPKDWSHV